MTVFWVIYSPNEAAISGGAGFWNGQIGWVEEEDAEVFTSKEKEVFSLPISTGGDARWMTASNRGVQRVAL